jgi:hypothetical protein
MMTKRNFLKTLAAGYSAGALGYPSNETIQIGCIGTGGRAQMLMKNLESIPGARIAAVCDVWDDNLAKARQLAGPSAFSTKDYRAVLDRKDIDVVLIGAPDHQHVPLTIAACEAGLEIGHLCREVVGTGAERRIRKDFSGHSRGISVR